MVAHMIPKWNMEGVLPPIWPGEDGVSQNRSPYPSTTTEVVDVFATSVDRLAILQGLLDYRQALYTAGIVDGFQWLDGSFMEDVESHQGRSPQDIDVVTYFGIPVGETQRTIAQKSPHLFNHGWVKAKYKVDSYYEVLGEAFAERHVLKLSYWYSMWSHNRNQTWKGFVRVNLDPTEDAFALQVLQSKRVGP
ncbi:MAG: hypothetical protein PHU07_07375 [Acidocella sp.]|nr:hypothetical protein [Acidocella sp.]